MSLLSLTTRASVSLPAALILLLGLSGCRGSSTGSGAGSAAPQPVTDAAPSHAGHEGGGDGPAPPDSGDIVVTPSGVSQGGTTMTYQDSTSVWIPAGFAGNASQITLNAGARGSFSLVSATVNFSSGAGLKVTTGSPAVWQCRVSASDAWSTCTTQAGTTLPSLFTIDASHSPSVSTPSGGDFPVAAGVSLTIK